MSKDSFQFGVYAGSVSGTPSGLARGLDDDLGATRDALDRLQEATERSLIVRAYLHYKGAQALESQGLCGGTDLFSQDFQALLSERRPLDLVLCFHDPDGGLVGWKQAISMAVEIYGTRLGRLQITEEANLRFGTGAIDGDYPKVVQALVQGVAFARAELDRHGLNAVPVGFSVAPALFGSGANSFWTDLKAASTSDFLSALGYVGADFFPDVFRPIALDQIPGSVVFLLRHFRESMTLAGIHATTPLIVTENGWPTGPDRSEERQAAVLQAIVETALSRREEFAVKGYTWFALRDADSTSVDLFHRFGLLRSDYTEKAAFAIFKKALEGNLPSQQAGNNPAIRVAE
ncbi:MAG TPA: hypothetical protein VIX42_08610 [Edaphobacter sp.]